MTSEAQATQTELYCPRCEKTYAAGERCPADNTRLVKIATAVDPLIGRELDGRFTILEKLGQGGMGTVYRGTQHSVGREIAIKVVKPSLVTDATVIKRFLREAKLASRLSHPNAVSVLEFGQTDDGLFFLVLELVAGRTLEKLVETEGVLSAHRLVRIGTQILDALEGAHDLQIVHRDLKPQNVMVMAKGRDLVKVLDFGIAKSLTPDAGATTVTNAGALLGTPAFMPPELIGNRDADGRSDLYSLGCVLYVCARGKLPFGGATAHEVMVQHATEEAEPITTLPPKLWAVIARLLQKDPDARFQTAAEARGALESALEPGAVEEPMSLPASASQPTMLGWMGNTPSGSLQKLGLKPTPTPRTPVGVPVETLVPPTLVPEPDDASLPTMIATPSKPMAIPPPPLPVPPLAANPIAASPSAASPHAAKAIIASPPLAAPVKPPTGTAAKLPTGPSPLAKPPTGPVPVVAAKPAPVIVPGSNRLPWIIAGAGVVIAIIIIVVGTGGGSDDKAPEPPALETPVTKPHTKPSVQPIDPPTVTPIETKPPPPPALPPPPSNTVTPKDPPAPETPKPPVKRPATKPVVKKLPPKKPVVRPPGVH